MRVHGTLAKWNDERGFGFIAPASGRDAIFVHISAFPRDGVRPRIGELVSFETETVADGKERAVRVMRPAIRARRSTPTSSATRRPFAGALALVTLASLGAYAFLSLGHAPRPAVPAPATERAEPQTPIEVFTCDGRTRCPQMRSCEEATFFLKNCPNIRMDGDGDGIPCEEQWCH